MEKIKIGREFKTVLMILAVAFVIVLVVFSFQDPWFDVFASPPGWGHDH